MLKPVQLEESIETTISKKGAFTLVNVNSNNTQNWVKSENG